MEKTFDIAAEILKQTANYVNPLLTRCEVCLHRVCRCHDEPSGRVRVSNHDLTLDQRLDDPRRS